uniref:Uncharacterized protein n=1 Tax=Lepeophtheirus salmonis TaxID=72036 RepID=A0A0K2UQM0_LEPSM
MFCAPNTNFHLDFEIYFISSVNKLLKTLHKLRS